MITKTGEDEFTLYCDNCCEPCYEEFEDFYAAVSYKKDKTNGWRTIKDKDGDWQELCPVCATPEFIRKLKGAEDS
jgi:hypothetical protein